MREGRRGREMGERKREWRREERVEYLEKGGERREKRE